MTKDSHYIAPMTTAVFPQGFDPLSDWGKKHLRDVNPFPVYVNWVANKNAWAVSDCPGSNSLAYILSAKTLTWEHPKEAVLFDSYDSAVEAAKNIVDTMLVGGKTWAEVYAYIIERDDHER